MRSRDGSVALRPWLLHGAAALACCGCTRASRCLRRRLLILLRLGSTKNPAAKAVAFLSIPAISAVLWAGFFVAIYGRPDPSAPHGPGGNVGSFAFVPGGLGGLLFDQRFGLLTYAPVVAVAFAGLVAMFFRLPFRRLALELFVITLPGDGDPLRHVVGRLQPAGAVLCTRAAAVRHSGGCRLDVRHAPRHQGSRRDLAAVDGLDVGDCRVRLPRPPGIQHARRTVAVAGVARPARRSHDRCPRVGARRGSAAVSRHRHLDRWRLRESSSFVFLERRVGRGRVLSTIAVAIVAAGVMLASTGGLGGSRDQRLDYFTVAAGAARDGLDNAPGHRVAAHSVVAAPFRRSRTAAMELSRALTPRRGGGEPRRSSRCRPFPRGAIASAR